jgi:DNA-binding transcriptional ArsR family regulator
MVNQDKLDAVFAALADPTRRRMVERLAHRAMSVGEMSAGFAISQPGISKHVKVLERAGLLRREIVGRVHRCRLEPKTIEAASSWIDDQRRFWSGTLDRLDAYLARTSASKTKKGR